ncbi:MAG: hypothetical protein ACOYMG_03245, partial [Candidatus Methylumidiphilus sp.]
LMDATNTPNPPTAPKLLAQVTERLRAKHYSIGTEMQYKQRIQRYLILARKVCLKKNGRIAPVSFMTIQNQTYKL